jgi:predicted PurR-regulated permease PerM
MYVRLLALLLAAALALYLCWLMLAPFVNVLAWAAVLVILFYPIHQRIVDFTGRPSWSALLSTAIVIAMILAPITLLTLAVAKEFGDLAKNIQGILHSLFDPDSPIMGRILAFLGRYIDVNQLNPHGYLLERLNSVSGVLAGRTLGIVGGLAGAIIQSFFIVFTMYYLFRDGAWIYNAMAQVVPLEPWQTRQIFDRTREVIHASVYGVIVIAGIQGTLGGLAFAALGLHSPLVWGVVMFFLSMIPFAGSFVVWVPAAAYLALSGHWGKALLLAVWGALVIGTIDNILRPKLVGGRTRLHELLIFFSVLGGLQIWGVLGLVLGPVVIAVTLALLDVLKWVDFPGKPVSTAPTTADPADP